MSINVEFMLREFAKKHDLPKGTHAPEYYLERYRMVNEEMQELHDAMSEGDKVKILDALVDIVYFAVGTAVQLDMEFMPAFVRVHNANMQKVRAYTERSAVDLVKPPGWKAPDLSDLV